MFGLARSPFHKPRQNKVPTSDPDTALAFVKYDLTAAEFIVSNNYNQADTLTQLNESWPANTPIADRNIQEFPNTSSATSFALKPVWNLVSQTGQTALPVWPGPPDPAKAFGSGAWSTCVIIDPAHKGPPSTAKGQCNNTSGTYPLIGVDAFIHFQITEEQAAGINEGGGGTSLPEKTTKAGDYAVLVAMHVTTKELKRWTWQTFWWSSNPDSPHAPSSAEIASLRSQTKVPLQGAAANYATCTAYQMVFPVQPYSGGSSSGTRPLFCYNPYLEAGFGSSTFDDQQGFGVQTNCMSCHANAHWPNPNNTPHYVTDQYVDLGGPQFSGITKVDFLWSIADNVK